jgi:hypothetical protein
MTKAIMIVPNTKDGLYAIKYLANEITEHNILIKMVSKKEFALVVKNAKGDSK